MSTYIDISHIMNWQGILTGIERVEYHLIKHYSNNTNTKFTYWDKENNFFVDIGKRDLVNEILSKNKPNTNKFSIKNLRKLAFRAKKIRISKDDVFIIPAGLWDDINYIDTLSTIDAKLVHVVYDMIPIVQPAYVVDFVKDAFYAYMSRVMRNVNIAMSISLSTQNDLVAVLNKEEIELPLLDTFRLGDDPFHNAANPVKAYEKIPKEYFLSVGTIEARKNHALFYYAYKSAKAKNIKLPKLVIAGKRGWLSEDIQNLIEKDPDVNSQIMIIDKVDDDTLAWLYKNSMLTIFPSFYEGWGLPVAESLMCGKVTLASNISSIPEVGLENVDYFSPFSTDELIKLMVKYSNNSKRMQREQEIKYVKTNWDTTGHEFYSKVNKLLNTIQ